MTKSRIKRSLPNVSAGSHSVVIFGNSSGNIMTTGDDNKINVALPAKPARRSAEDTAATLDKAAKALLRSLKKRLSQPELERIVNASKGFLDVAVWRDRLAQIELQVCRIDVDGKPLGTGFLVGRDVVLTNHHVIDGVDLSTLSARFDHKVLPNGTMAKGTTYPILAALDTSPPSPIDKQHPPKQGLPKPTELDYAFLRLQGAPADELVDGRARGVLKPAPGKAPSRGLVFIVQHPEGKPLKLAFDEIEGLNQNHTRITYKTNTLCGSSGSPCLDASFRLIALHHSGDPRLSQEATYNEGIPLSTIVANMQPALRTELGF